MDITAWLRTQHFSATALITNLAVSVPATAVIILGLVSQLHIEPGEIGKWALLGLILLISFIAAIAVGQQTKQLVSKKEDPADTPPAGNGGFIRASLASALLALSLAATLAGCAPALKLIGLGDVPPAKLALFVCESYKGSLDAILDGRSAGLVSDAAMLKADEVRQVVGPVCDSPDQAAAADTAIQAEVLKLIALKPAE